MSIQVCLVCGAEIEAMAYKGTGACCQPHLEELRKRNQTVIDFDADTIKVALLTAPPPGIRPGWESGMTTYTAGDWTWKPPSADSVVWPTILDPKVVLPVPGYQRETYLIDYHDGEDWCAYGTAQTHEAAHVVIDEMTAHAHAPKRWRIMRRTTIDEIVEES